MIQVRQHDGGLAAVLRGVVDLVNHQLPQGIGKRLTAGIGVSDDRVELLGIQGRDERVGFGLYYPPAVAERLQVGVFLGVQHGGRGVPLPTGEPDPLSAQGVDERVSK